MKLSDNYKRDFPIIIQLNEFDTKKDTKITLNAFTIQMIMMKDYLLKIYLFLKISEFEKLYIYDGEDVDNEFDLSAWVF